MVPDLPPLEAGIGGRLEAGASLRELTEESAGSERRTEARICGKTDDAVYEC
jgi:hypothetical protein